MMMLGRDETARTTLPVISTNKAAGIVLIAGTLVRGTRRRGEGLGAELSI